jgi:pyruvate/2-oxoglutarate dehydrogenase complex dihydrolipoamide acyltransferase (E2) component
VPIIELLVKVGDEVKAEDSLMTLESDKATMDIPCPVSGVVTELKVKVGDKVAEGVVLAMVKTSADGATTAPAPTNAAAAPRHRQQHRFRPLPRLRLSPQLRVLAPTFAQATPS